VPVVIDTADVPAGDRFAYWRTAFQHQPVALDVEPLGPGDFQGRRALYGLASLTVSRTTCDASLVARTRASIVRVDPAVYVVSVHLSGRYTVSCEGRSDVCTDGDIVIWDSARPLLVRPHARQDVMSVFVPKRVVGPPLPTGVRIDGSAGRARLVRSLLAEVVRGLERGEIGPDDQGVADAVIDLVRTLRVPAPPPDRSLLGAIKRSIDARLDDPRLSPDVVARDNHVSRRYLYRLFEADGTGVADWIRARRLERCARDLTDPALAHEPITTIAMRWGFVNPSHFSRVFRRTFGCSPREYRGR
jgi:AraC-like DNA-binding protein